MALYVWKCKQCAKVTKKLLTQRPVLDKCTVCSGEQSFVTNVMSRTMEVIDNGLMAKAVERPTEIEAKIAERNALAEKPDDPIV